MIGKSGFSRYFNSITIDPSAPRVRSSLKRPRLSHALRKPTVKHSDKKAKTSKMVDLPLPLGPKKTVRGVIPLSSRSHSAR